MVPTVTKDFQRTTLRPRHRPVVRALAEAFFSPDGEANPAALEALVGEVDRFISPASKTLRFGLGLMLDIIRYSPFFFGHFRTFDELSVDERVHHLERLERSKVTQLPLLVVGYKTMLTMLFYEDPVELAALGYSDERRRFTRKLPLAPLAPPTVSAAAQERAP